MSGHSKWSTIKHKKAAMDAKRGRLFTRLLKEVTVAARLGGGDANANPRLRHAIQDAKSNNVASDSIDRAVKKGLGELEGITLEEVNYEGYGPGGVAVLVEVVTDNRNRTVSEIRHLFSKHGGSLGETGCVSWIFEKRGYFVIEPGSMDEESFMELAVEVDAEDFSVDGEGFEIYTSQENYSAVREELGSRDLPLGVQELAMVPQSYVQLDEKAAGQVLRLMAALENHDDVQNVWANFDIDEDVLAKIG